MKVAILGGTRGIGRELLSQLIEAGEQVTVLARDPTRLDLTSEHLRVQKGDARDRDAVRALVANHDAVCSCLGIRTRARVTLFSDSTSYILEQESDGPRILAVTGVGAGDSRGHGGFLYDKIFFPLLLREVYEDKNRQEQLLRSSTVSWTIIRPGALTNGPRTGKYRVFEDLTGVTVGRISRADVADFMVSELRQPTYERRTVNLSY